MAKIYISRNQLIEHLDENLEFLKRSCESFDLGYISEAKRLAVTIRVLLHDTGNSKSLLNQLGIKNSMVFYNTANPFNPKNLVVHNGLVGVRMDSGQIRFVAPLEESVEIPGRPNNFVSFSDWWDETIIKDSENTTYTRGDLVKILANKDGGAHVDPQINSNYEALKKTNRMLWQYVQVKDGIESKSHIKDVELHSIRQIAFELIKSIEKIRPNL